MRIDFILCQRTRSRIYETQSHDVSGCRMARADFISTFIRQLDFVVQSIRSCSARSSSTFR